MLLPLVEKRLKGDFEKKNMINVYDILCTDGYGFSDIKNCIDNIKKNMESKLMYNLGLVSLGCAKNQTDAEIMLGILANDGFNITYNPSDADVIIVNTLRFYRVG